VEAERWRVEARENSKILKPGLKTLRKFDRIYRIDMI